MKLAICGSRDLIIGPYDIGQMIATCIDTLGLHPQYLEKTVEIVSGGGGNVDLAAKRYAASPNPDWDYDKPLKYKEFPADWDKHGKAAGPIRNKQIAEYSDALLIIWDGESRGSKNMKEEMMRLKKPIYEIILKRYNV